MMKLICKLAIPARIFHAPIETRTERRVRAPGLQGHWLSGCRPGALTRRPGCEIFGLVVAAFLFTTHQSAAAEAKILYENNFEKAEVGKVPEDFLVLDGAFA